MGTKLSMSRLDFSDTSIYDEIYGYIPLTNVELKLVNHHLFQRLNHIKQLGTAFRVFPGAQHTRFSHSLGVMRIMDEMTKSKNLAENSIILKNRQKLRVAALLHDIGHYPLSHVTETIMTEQDTRDKQRHDKLGEHIITKSSIKDIMEKNSIDPSEIGQIITGQHPEPLFNQLMSSELDADRIDYLLRDSIHTGVAYGRFDLDRLIHTLTLDKNNQLCIERSGMHAAEGYVVGRYLMWAVVYTHTVINAFEELIQEICRRQLGSAFPIFEQIKNWIEEDESKFVNFDDNAIFRIIQDKVDDKMTAELRRMLQERKPLVVAREAQWLSEDGVEEKEYFLLDQYRKRSKVDELSKKSDVPAEWIFHNSSRTNLPRLKPLLERPSIEVEETEREMTKVIRVADENG